MKAGIPIYFSLSSRLDEIQVQLPTDYEEVILDYLHKLNNNLGLIPDVAYGAMANIENGAVREIYISSMVDIGQREHEFLNGADVEREATRLRVKPFFVNNETTH